MKWLTLPGLTDGQYLWVVIGVVGFMLLTGWLMARSLWRTHRRARSRRTHPTNRPYDWKQDAFYRRPWHVRRVA